MQQSRAYSHRTGSYDTSCSAVRTLLSHLLSLLAKVNRVLHNSSAQHKLDVLHAAALAEHTALVMCPSASLPSACSLFAMCGVATGNLLKYYTSERDVGRQYRGVLSLEVRAPPLVVPHSVLFAVAIHASLLHVMAYIGNKFLRLESSTPNAHQHPPLCACSNETSSSDHCVRVRLHAWCAEQHSSNS